MLRYTIRRLIFAVPTLLVISFIIFALLDLAPSDPTGQPAADHPARGAREDPREPRPRPALPHPLSLLAAAVLRERAAEHHPGVDRLADRRPRPAARRLVVDALARRRPDRRAHAADALGRRHVLRRRHPDRRADRRHLGLSAVFLVRPGRHLLLDGRLLGADLLHRPAADRDLLGLDADQLALLAALDLRHDAARAPTGRASSPSSSR